MRLYIILFIGVLSVSFAAIFIRLAEAPPLVVATCRMAIAAAIMVPVALTRSQTSLKSLAFRDMFWLMLSGFFLALHFGLWITSLDYTSIASSVVLVTSHPAFVAVVSYFVWGEKPGRLSIAGIAIALAGVVVINYGGFTFSPRAILGDWLALAAAFSMG
ncbi:MAG: DMT family transporter, partial [Dehalococcoidales bacterium]